MRSIFISKGSKDKLDLNDCNKIMFIKYYKIVSWGKKFLLSFLVDLMRHYDDYIEK